MNLLFEIAKTILPRPTGERRQRWLVAFQRFCRIFPVNKRKVVFSCFNGTKYSDNPRAVYEAMVQMRPSWKYIWLMSDSRIKFRHSKVVSAGSFEAVYHLTTAGLWIDNCRKNYWLTKRKNQYYTSNTNCDTKTG